MLKLEVQTEYERFIIQLPDAPAELTAPDIIVSILAAAEAANVVFEGADDREGQLIFIAGGKESIKHIAILPNEEIPTVEEPTSYYRQQEGPVQFTAHTSFLGQATIIQGVRYICPKQAGLFGSIYLPLEINGKPAMDQLNEASVKKAVIDWRLQLGDNPRDFIVLVPPGELSPEQSVEYCVDYLKVLRADTPYVAEEKTAKAYFGFKPNADI